jgi:soluble lytic murein transglycosylase-like protein
MRIWRRRRLRMRPRLIPTCDRMTPALAFLQTVLLSMCGPGADRFAGPVAEAAELYDIDPRVIVSQMRQESTCDPEATGALGEIGLMQLKRGTRATQGYDKLTDKQLRRPALNIRLGARHLRFCMDRCGGSVSGALCLYKGLRKSRKTGLCRECSYAGAILARITES